MMQFLLPALALVVCATASGQLAPVAARVSSVTGTVLLSNGDGMPPFAASHGFALNPGDRVDTRNGGRAVLDLTDGSLVIVQPGTLLTIRDYRAAASVRELFEIAIGAVRVKIHHLTGKPNPYRMNSPTASIAVRGTEFDVFVDHGSGTRVEVLEGAVEVASLTDASQSMRIEAGGGVLVRTGQAFHFYGIQIARAGPIRAPAARNAPRRGPPMPHAGAPAPHEPLRRPLAAVAGRNPPNGGRERHSGDGSGSWLVRVTDVNPIPTLYRFNAFSDLHLDALENPAYAADARVSEVRTYLIPTQAWSTRQNTTMTGISPQVSAMQPLGKGIVAGGAFAVSRFASTGSVTSAMSRTGLLAGQLGSSGIGLSFESVAAQFSDRIDSRTGQTRFNAGITHKLSDGHNLGAFVRYGWLATEGRTAEAGFRLRGSVTPKVLYGVAGTVSSFNDGTARLSRRSVAAGLGAMLSPRTLLAVDVTAGVSSFAGVARDRELFPSFASVHMSMQRDLTRRLFSTISFLNTWPAGNLSSLPLQGSTVLALAQFGGRTRYAEPGVGVRLSSGLFAQYLYTRDFALRAADHRLVLSFTFRGRE